MPGVSAQLAQAVTSDADTAAPNAAPRLVADPVVERLQEAVRVALAVPELTLPARLRMDLARLLAK